MEGRRRSNGCSNVMAVVKHLSQLKSTLNSSRAEFRICALYVILLLQDSGRDEKRPRPLEYGPHALYIIITATITRNCIFSPFSFS